MGIREEEGAPVGRDCGSETLRKVSGTLCLLAVAFSLLARPGASEDPELKALFRQGIPQSPFIAVVYGYADAILKHDRDVHGSRETGLFLSILDRKTLSPLPSDVGSQRRLGARGRPLAGSNLSTDQNLLRLLFFLKDLSGQDRYSQAAEGALRWFMENAQAPHEFSRPWLLWDKCFELAPEPSRRFAQVLWNAHAAALEKGLRDPSVRQPPPEAREESPRQAGFFIRTWAEVYAHTGVPAFQEAMEAVLERREAICARELAAGSAGSGATPASRLSLAIDCHGAARRVPEPLRTRLALLASREDELFSALSHSLKDRKGFAASLSPSGPAFTPLWRRGGEEETTAQIAMMCVSRYENTGNVRYRDLMVAAADAYLDSLPDDASDEWPMTFGHAISLELAAFRATAREPYFRQAYRLGQVAVEKFFGGLPLPRASLKSEHYENSTGADTLALALAELHLTTLHITAVRAPVNTLDR